MDGQDREGQVWWGRIRKGWIGQISEIRWAQDTTRVLFRSMFGFRSYLNLSNHNHGVRDYLNLTK